MRTLSAPRKRRRQHVAITRLVADERHPYYVSVHPVDGLHGGMLTNCLLPGDEIWIVSERRHRPMLLTGPTQLAA